MMNERKVALIVTAIAVVMVVITYFAIDYYLNLPSVKARQSDRQWVVRERLEAVNFGGNTYANITVAVVFDNPELHKKAFLNRSRLREAMLLAVTNAVNTYGSNLTHKQITESIQSAPYFLDELKKPEIYLEEYVVSRSF